MILNSSLLSAQTIYYDVKFTNFDELQREKVYKALDSIMRVVETDEFHQFVLNFTYKGKKRFAENNNLTNEEIYQKILAGAENFRPIQDQTMNLNLNLYYKRNSTVGYTYPGVEEIYINNYFFAGYEVKQVARNLFHEWLHKLGFDHKSSKKSVRPYSVPYAVGNKMMELVGKLD